MNNTKYDKGLMFTALIALVILLALSVRCNRLGGRTANAQTADAATAGGQTFYDLNGDGELQDGEPGIEDLEIWVNDAYTVTTSIWNWRAYSLPPGSYTFEVDAESIPDFFVATTTLSYTVDLQPGDEVLDLNLGFRIDPGMLCSDLDGVDIWSPPNHGEQFYPLPDGDQYGPVVGTDVVYNVYDGESFGIRIQCMCPDDPDEPAVMTTYLVVHNWMDQNLIDSASAEDWFLVQNPEFYHVGWEEGGTLLARNTDNDTCVFEPQEWRLLIPLLMVSPPPPPPACPQKIQVNYLGYSEVVDFTEWPGQMRTLGLFAAGTEVSFEMIEGSATQSNLSWPSWYQLQGSGPEWVYNPTSTIVPPHPGLGIPYEFHVWNSGGTPDDPYCIVSFQLQWDP